LLYIFIGPSIPYLKPLHGNNFIIIAGTVLGASILSLAFFLSYRTSVLKAHLKDITITVFLFLAFSLTIAVSILVVTLEFQIVATFNDTSVMSKSRLLSHGKSVWDDKDWDAGQFLAKLVFRDYGLRIAYHRQDGDVTIFSPDNKDMSIRDRNIETEQEARKIFPALLDQAKRHRIYSYIYFVAFLAVLLLSILWSLLNNRRLQSR
jgi:hypothetical protein